MILACMIVGMVPSIANIIFAFGDTFLLTLRAAIGENSWLQILLPTEFWMDGEEALKRAHWENKLVLATIQNNSLWEHVCIYSSCWRLLICLNYNYIFYYHSQL